MKLTNRLGLPKAIVDAVANDPYSKGDADISITGLLRPPRIRVLEKKHKEQLEEDVSDRIYSLLGQTMHGILERAALARQDANNITEKRFYITIDGVRVGGQMDSIYLEQGLLQDYKLTSVYKVKEGAPKEFEEQLNCYAYLLRSNGIIVSKLQDVCILRDWSKGKALQEPDLPQEQVVVLDVPMWPAEQAEAFLKERVAVHKAANKKLPECTPEERWAEPDKWAVMQKGAKRSLKNHLNQADAEEHAARVGARVEHRPGSNKRCEAWCSVSEFCTQFKTLKGDK